MKRLGLLCAALLLWPILGITEIREIQKMSEIEAAVGAETLVVFDIDNTILTPPQMLASDSWFDHMLAKSVTAGENREAAMLKAVSRWVNAQTVTQVESVEREAAR